MEKYFLGALFFLCSIPALAQVYICKDAHITFFSSAPIEDIKGESTTAVSALNIKTRSIYFKVLIRSFKFENGLMQEHFNEDYLESAKYPYAEFKGKITDSVNLSKPGIYPVTVQGDLTIHNITKSYTIKGKIEVKEGQIFSDAVFDLKPSDHHIQIPILLSRELAKTVQITENATYIPYSSE